MMTAFKQTWKLSPLPVIARHLIYSADDGALCRSRSHICG